MILIMQLMMNLQVLMETMHKVESLKVLCY
jgi:hypothetical protein